MIQIETILDLLWKGFIIGVIVSAPLGPVGVLCIQRTLNKGRWYGFVTGMGAALSDICYALLTGYGMSFVFDYVNKNIFYLQLFGSILLLFFGVYTFRSNPVRSLRPPSGNKGTYLHNFVTAFFVTLSNPLIIFLFVGLFARFSFVGNGALVSETVTGCADVVVRHHLFYQQGAHALQPARHLDAEPHHREHRGRRVPPGAGLHADGGIAVLNWK